MSGCCVGTCSSACASGVRRGSLGRELEQELLALELKFAQREPIASGLRYLAARSPALTLLWLGPREPPARREPAPAIHTRCVMANLP